MDKQYHFEQAERALHQADRYVNGYASETASERIAALSRLAEAHLKLMEVAPDSE